MSCKEQIVEEIRQLGYDFFTSCVLANHMLCDFKDSTDTKKSYYIKDKQFILIKGDKQCPVKNIQ
jgi:hypothetical protein